ncbi:hypothetical protein glysoja_045622, partial [Glycine soja]
MKNGETISRLQTRFTHIVNHLLSLGKMFEDEELNIKILNCLTRTWEPKITTIKESKNLATMTMEALFGKLFAYEHELTQQSYAKESEKKRKGITLKVNSSKEEYKDSSNSEEDVENFNLMVRKFGKFLRKSRDRKFSKSPKKNDNNNYFTCFKCGKQGYIKSECPIYLRKYVGEMKGKKDRNKRKAYIAWKDIESTTSDSSYDEEIANICLMEKSMNDASINEEIE